MKVIIAGSRSITDPQHTLDAIRESKFEITMVISGLAEGPDKHGLDWAKANSIDYDEKPAKWYIYEDIGEGRFKKRYDPTGGFKRNQEMAEVADALIAVWDGKSNGTQDMIDRAKKMGLRIFIWNINDPPVTFRFS